jgi:hypothetical protein
MTPDLAEVRVSLVVIQSIPTLTRSFAAMYLRQTSRVKLDKKRRVVH